MIWNKTKIFGFLDNNNKTIYTMDSALYVDIVETISTYTYFNISTNVAPCALDIMSGW